MTFHPTLFSFFHQIQTNPGDTRFIGYCFEHTFQWISGAPSHAQFWSPPFFYAAKNTMAYSDLMIGTAPFYWVWRVVGCLPDTALQLWMLTMASCNFWCSYLLFRRGFRLSSLAGSVGAFMFSFGAPRVNQLNHLQLQPHFYSLLVVLALLILFRRDGQKIPMNHQRLAIGTFFACVVLEVYSSFYLAWFLVTALAVMGVVALVIPRMRSRMHVLKNHIGLLIICVGFSGAALVPVINHYLSASADVGPRWWDEVWRMLPTLSSWFYLGPQSWLYGWMTPMFRLATEYEERLGVGFVSVLVAVVGLIHGRKRLAVWLACAVALILVGLTIYVPPDFSLWRWIFQWIPGANGLRAIARVGLVLLFLWSLGAALFFESIRYRWHGVLRWGLVLLVVLEQGVTTFSYDKYELRRDAAALAAQIPSTCQYFVYTPHMTPQAILDVRARYHIEALVKVHLDAMAAQLLTGKPTINGYSGHNPPEWGLDKPYITNPEDEQPLSQRVTYWIRKNQLNPSELSWIK